jgi:hypothetical protein
MRRCGGAAPIPSHLEKTKLITLVAAFHATDLRMHQRLHAPKGYARTRKDRVVRKRAAQRRRRFSGADFQFCNPRFVPLATKGITDRLYGGVKLRASVFG